MIVIGTSAGGIDAAGKLFTKFPDNPDAAVFMVLHLSAKSDAEVIKNIFQRITSLKCVVPSNGDIIQKGYLYIAPNDFHIVVKDGHIGIMQGPREHRFRPSIDVLFRSAAVEFNSRVVGIILTGMLDDGAAGMAAIKKCGGICIVQDPSDAEFSQMPLHVLDRISPDYILSLDEIGYVVDDILSKPVPPAVPVPLELKLEAGMTDRIMTSVHGIEEIAEKSEFICPDCGGGLWKINNEPLHRYRCHVGHAYSEEKLLEIKQKDLEESVWVSIRMLEERFNLLNRMSRHSLEAGNEAAATLHQERATEAEKHIEALKVIQANLTKSMSYPENPDSGLITKND